MSPTPLHRALHTGCLACLLPLLVTACGGGEPGASDDRFRGDPWTLTGPAIRIGSLDDPDYAFASVWAIAVGPTGFVYSLHLQEASVRRWTPLGEPAGIIGREGEGPGEFSAPGSLGFFGDTLWVMDRRAFRVSYFDGEGSFLGSVTPRVDISRGDDNSPASPPRPVRPLRDGTLYGNSPGWSRDIAVGDLTRTPHVHMDAEGATLATVWIQPWRTTDILALLREGGGTFTSQPFGDQPLTSHTRDGALLVLDRRTYDGGGVASIRVTKIGMTGDTLFHREIEYDPEPLPGTKVDSAASATAERMHGFMSRSDPGLSLGDLERDLKAATYAPDYVPAVRGMIATADGFIWLRRYTPLVEGEEWWVLNADGMPVGRAVTPTGLRVLHITDDAVWGVESDEFDVNYIVRYDIIRGGQ